MPELPEVVVTLRGVVPHILGKDVQAVVVRESRLRWPVSPGLPEKLCGMPLLEGRQRGKYLLFRFPQGHLMIHLGMSGSLRIVTADTPAAKHDHVDICFTDDTVLRYSDPRRFGSILWVEGLRSNMLGFANWVLNPSHPILMVITSIGCPGKERCGQSFSDG